MDDKGPRSIIPKSGGVFHELATRLKLIARLMADRRVNPLVKLLPVGALAYWLIPDLAPGPIDDALLMWLGGYMFVELCPPDASVGRCDRHDAHSTGQAPRTARAGARSVRSRGPLSARAARTGGTSSAPA